VSELSEQAKAVDAANILEISLKTIQTWATDGEIPMNRNPANGYGPFRRNVLEKFLREIAQPVNRARRAK
jgi:predicted site-specific integrase-resolvase